MKTIESEIIRQGQETRTMIKEMDASARAIIAEYKKELAVYRRAEVLASRNQDIAWKFSQIMLQARKDADNEPTS